MNLVLGKPRHEGPVPVMGLENGEVRAHDDVQGVWAVIGADRFNEWHEFWVHLGRPARQVEGVRAGGLEDTADLAENLWRHPFPSIRAGIDVTVCARLVADGADVDLKDVEPGRAQRREAALAELFVKMGPAVRTRLTEWWLGELGKGLVGCGELPLTAALGRFCGEAHMDRDLAFCII